MFRVSLVDEHGNEMTPVCDECGSSEGVLVITCGECTKYSCAKCSGRESLTGDFEFCPPDGKRNLDAADEVLNDTWVIDIDKLS